MAPPDWVFEKRLSHEERKKLAQERMTRILAQQNQEAQHALQDSLTTTPKVQNPSTPILGVSFERLQLTNSQAIAAEGAKRKRDDTVGDEVVYEQRRRGSFPDSRRGSASSSARAITSGAPVTNQQVNSGQFQSPQSNQSPNTYGQPDWYKAIPQKRLQQAGANRNVDAKLEQIKTLIKQCKAKPENAELGRLFDRIRDELHDLVFLQVSDIALRRKRMLHDDSGLPQLFDQQLNDCPYPWDIQADAWELYNRWGLRVFSIDLLRGIVKRPSTGTSGNRSTDRIDPAYPGKMKADFHGNGCLVNGQWWPTQLCTVRDGAHGSTQGGIYATKGNPAFSIVLSGGNHYKDRDEGENLWYSGTDGKDGKFSDNTHSLILSISSGKPVRVIRSHNLAQGASVYRPPRGFRYDGLYKVLSYEVFDEYRKACLFHLRRMPDQDPIRYCGKEMRPTAAEIREYDKFKADIEASERI